MDGRVYWWSFYEQHGNSVYVVSAEYGDDCSLSAFTCKVNGEPRAPHAGVRVAQCASEQAAKAAFRLLANISSESEGARR